MSVQIRPATEADLLQILSIVNQAILNTTAIYDYEARTPEQQQAWWEEKQAGNFPVVVAENNGEVAGFGTYGAFRIKVGYRFTVEHSVYVAQSHAGKGVGKLILSHLIASAKAQKYHTMIGVIDASNAGSIAFHQKFGFAETGILKEVGFKFGKWLDVSLMQLMLE